MNDTTTPPIPPRFAIGDIVTHKIFGKTAIITKIHQSTCQNPKHKNKQCQSTTATTGTSIGLIFAELTKGPCQFVPIDLYDITIDFDKTVKYIEGSLLSPHQ